MGQVVIKIPEDVFKEYNVASITQIESILQVLDQQLEDKEKRSLESWKQSLLTLSTWIETEIEAVEEVRVFIDQWNPQQLFLTQAS